MKVVALPQEQECGNPDEERESREEKRRSITRKLGLNFDCQKWQKKKLTEC